jgi:hypothetical protein
MFLTSDAEEVNRNFDAKQECATRSASVLANLSPFRFEVQSGSFLYSRHVDKASANAETPKIVACASLAGFVRPCRAKRTSQAFGYHRNCWNHRSSYGGHLPGVSFVFQQ